MEFPPEHEGIAIIPSSMRQFAIKYHADSLMHAIMLYMPRSFQSDHSECSRFNPGMGSLDPWPSAQRAVMCPGIIRFPRILIALCFKEKMDSTILSRSVRYRTLPRQDGKSRRPIGLRMLSIRAYAAVFVLLTGEARTVHLDEIILAPDCTQGQNSPGSGIGTESAVNLIRDSTPRQGSPRKLLASDLLERRECHVGYKSLAA
jgi:hypothetical protein